MENFIKSGSTLLDLILGGGYALGRMAHVVGDPSTGKTQLAIEACANFHRQFPNGVIRYCDAEAAFDVDYAIKLGLPDNDVDFIQATKEEHGITVEDFHNSLIQHINDCDNDEPGLYLLDSLDALPTIKEASEPIESRTGYGAEKAKMLSDIFRSSVQQISNKQICLFVISQTRDNISGYGPKKIFSGGNASKFYASQRLMLKKKETLKKGPKGLEMPYGIKVSALCDKNKVGVPFRDCEYDIIFDYGIDDITNNLEYLEKAGALHLLPKDLASTASGSIVKSAQTIVERVRKITEKKEKAQVTAEIEKAVKNKWASINEEMFAKLPSGKYD